MRNLAGILVALTLIALIVSATWWQRSLLSGLPAREEHPTAAAALAAAHDYAARHGGTVRAVAGTGSMAPYIPPAPAGSDPRRTIVAYTVTDPHATFADIRRGKLVTYAAEWRATGEPLVLHQAATQDRAGWIMTGLANDSYESRWRVTPANFRGITARVFIITPLVAP